MLMNMYSNYKYPMGMGTCWPYLLNSEYFPATATLVNFAQPNIATLFKPTKECTSIRETH